MNNNEFYTRIEHPLEVYELIEKMAQPGDAFMLLDKGQDKPISVVIRDIVRNKHLELDITAAHSHLSDLLAGTSFRLRRSSGAGIIITPPLKAYNCREDNTRLFCECDYPSYLDNLQRRAAFRAQIHNNMQLKTTLRIDSGPDLKAKILDISMTGCRLELSRDYESYIEDKTQTIELILDFPDGTQFACQAKPRHHIVGKQTLRCGFQLLLGSETKQQQLAKLTREIEREYAMLTSHSRVSRFMQSSTLFTKK